MSTDLEYKLERAKLIERARLEKHWTKKQLAERAGYDEKTLYNLLSGGEVHAKTVFDFCQALAIEVPEIVGRKVEIAPDLLGGYSRSTYDEYEGDFFIYRPSFSRPDCIYKYIMTIGWDPIESSFRFRTFYKIDPKEAAGAKTHGGPVSISAITNLVHFVVTFRGSVRLVTVTKMRSADGIMRGCMSTHFEDLNFFRPTLSPLVIRKVENYDRARDMHKDIGLIDRADPEWTFARDQLGVTERQVLNLCFAGTAR